MTYCTHRRLLFPSIPGLHVQSRSSPRPPACTCRPRRSNAIHVRCEMHQMIHATPATCRCTGSEDDYHLQSHTCNDTSAIRMARILAPGILNSWLQVDVSTPPIASWESSNTCSLPPPQRPRKATSASVEPLHVNIQHECSPQRVLDSQARSSWDERSPVRLHSCSIMCHSSEAEAFFRFLFTGYGGKWLQQIPWVHRHCMHLHDDQNRRPMPPPELT